MGIEDAYNASCTEYRFDHSQLAHLGLPGSFGQLREQRSTLQTPGTPRTVAVLRRPALKMASGLLHA